MQLLFKLCIFKIRIWPIIWCLSCFEAAFKQLSLVSIWVLLLAATAILCKIVKNTSKSVAIYAVSISSDGSVAVLCGSCCIWFRFSWIFAGSELRMAATTLLHCCCLLWVWLPLQVGATCTYKSLKIQHIANTTCWRNTVVIYAWLCVWVCECATLCCTCY